MRPGRKLWIAGLRVLALGVMLRGWKAEAAGPAAAPKLVCSSVTFEAELTQGKSLERVFAEAPGGEGKGLKLVVQAIASGWIVRVVPSSGPWGEHDRAELATPPFLSPNPLVVSTDYAFRAQDAIAWNPRRFRYAASDATYRRLLELYPRVLKNDAAAESELAQLSVAQPEGELRILDATVVPGTADQWRMAAAVASHLENTPHEVAQGGTPSKLGSLQSLRVRVHLELPAGMKPGAGLSGEKNPCVVRPTT